MYEQLHLDNNKRNWDHNYILDEGNQTYYYFDEIHLNNNASLQMKSGDGVSRTLDVNKLFGDRSGRVYMRSYQECHLEEFQTQTKLPTNIWVDEGSRAYMSPMVYILGLGEIAFRWNGEIINVRHLRIVPGRVIQIDINAMTSYIEEHIYVQGTPGTFEFATFEMGANAKLQLPSPMALVLTVGILVSLMFISSHGAKLHFRLCYGLFVIILCPFLAVHILYIPS